MSRPKIKIKNEPIDNFIEIIALLGLAMLIIYPIILYADLPDKIPTHYDSAGNPDAFGNKSSIWILPIIGFLTYGLFHVINKFPHTFNYGGIKITKKNAPNQYRIALRMMRTLKTLIVLVFAYITWTTEQIALGNAYGLGKNFLPIFLILILGSVGFGLYKNYEDQ